MSSRSKASKKPVEKSEKKSSKKPVEKSDKSDKSEKLKKSSVKKPRSRTSARASLKATILSALKKTSLKSKGFYNVNTKTVTAMSPTTVKKLYFYELEDGLKICGEKDSKTLKKILELFKAHDARPLSIKPSKKKQSSSEGSTEGSEISFDSKSVSDGSEEEPSDESSDKSEGSSKEPKPKIEVMESSEEIPKESPKEAPKEIPKKKSKSKEPPKDAPKKTKPIERQREPEKKIAVKLDKVGFPVVSTTPSLIADINTFTVVCKKTTGGVPTALKADEADELYMMGYPMYHVNVLKRKPNEPITDSEIQDFLKSLYDPDNEVFKVFDVTTADILNDEGTDGTEVKTDEPPQPNTPIEITEAAIAATVKPTPNITKAEYELMMDAMANEKRTLEEFTAYTKLSKEKVQYILLHLKDLKQKFNTFVARRDDETSSSD